ncbi:sulfotransferase [Lysobacter sp. KIS68-7]|uniref:tetratricopeptide repeat-containing sulfotransferase family protein n=1 Tax=Lysobacter sp. KIS68-7 TaxID=2904252 RepID=UPI001E5C5FF3|nr:sulfotransferase [Lysobacter sp. KIS68-7]UHQ18529.1 sulfotransferase [Lysobacter sp. KIS68-7]
MPTPSLETWQSAERHLGEGRRDDARTAYLTLADEPAFAALAQLRLSLIASHEGRGRDAVAHALAASKAHIEDPDITEMVCKRLLTLGEAQAAVQLTRSPAVMLSKRPGPLAQLGRTLIDYTQPEAALRVLRTARSKGWDSARIRCFTGIAEMQLGNDDAAEGELEGALEGGSDFPRAARALSTLRKQTPERNHVDALRASLARLGDTHADAPQLYYALFKELDDLDDIDGAWQALDTGMQLRRAQVPYDGAAEQALFDHLQRLKVAPGTHTESEGPMPVFIVGLPRSGTALLQRFLARHDQIADAGELRDFTYQLRWMCDAPGGPNLDLALAQRADGITDWAQLGERYLDHTRWRAARLDAPAPAVYLDTWSPNFLELGHIVRALPNARIVHMIRDPMETCFANLKELFASASPHTYDQADMADHYKRYRQLMAHWTAMFPGRIHQVRHADLVNEPEGTTREMLEHLGLPWQPGIVDATIVRTQGRWRRYEEHLAPLRQRLGSYAYSARS